jgi:hypothetical protein
MKKILAITALAALACSSAMAATVQIKDTVPATCEITSAETITAIDFVSGSRTFNTEYSCNIQPQMTISSANGGLVAPGVSSKIRYAVSFQGVGSGLFNSSSFKSEVGHDDGSEDGIRTVTAAGAGNGASVIYFGRVSDGTTTDGDLSFEVFLEQADEDAALPGEYSDTVTINIEAKL